MNPSHPSRRRTREVRLAAEALESRSLMTGGAGNSFAIIPGTVAKAGDVTAVKFTIDPAHFHVPKGKFTLGIDVAPDPTGSLKPMIVTVKDAGGKVVPRTQHATYDPHLANIPAGTGRQTTAVLAPIQLNVKNPKAPVTYEVDVRGLSNTSGKFLLAFYLPGDANGDGVVNQADTTAIQGSLGALGGTPKYSFNADSNRDGRVTRADLQYTQINQGVSTDVTPVVSANLDPAGIVDVNQRVSRNPAASFTGTLSPGASVKFQEVNNQVPPTTTTADARGNYTITVPLAKGQNTFHVSTVDSFGQAISGTLSPVTYNPNPAVTPTSYAALLQQASDAAKVTGKTS